jgi:hypothetical protein
MVFLIRTASGDYTRGPNSQNVTMLARPGFRSPGAERYLRREPTAVRLLRISVGVDRVPEPSHVEGSMTANACGCCIGR